MTRSHRRSTLFIECAFFIRIYVLLRKRLDGVLEKVGLSRNRRQAHRSGVRRRQHGNISVPVSFEQEDAESLAIKVCTTNVAGFSAESSLLVGSPENNLGPFPF